MILTEAKTYRKAFIDVVLPSICWGAGYAGMWSAKWILGTIILKRNVLAEAMGAATARSGIVIQEEGGIEINGLSPIMVTLRILASKPFLIIFSVTLLIILLFCIYNVIQKRKFDFLSPRNMQFLIIAIYPIIWSQVLKIIRMFIPGLHIEFGASVSLRLHFFFFGVWEIQIIV